jgi:HSP20 family protein
MANLTRRDNGNRQFTRDPFSFARDLLAWDPFDQTRPVANGFVPRFEVKERDDAFVFHADLPGVTEDNLDISMQNGVLSISGSRVAEEKKEGESYYLYERKFGSFSRAFSLPDVADPEKVEADLKDGILTITVGKRVEAKPRKIGLKKA